MKQSLQTGLLAIAGAVIVTLAGVVAMPLAYGVYVIFLIFLVIKNSWSLLFLFTLITFILGDSHFAWLSYWYNLRFISIILLFFISLYWILSSKVKLSLSLIWILFFILVAIISAIRGPITVAALSKTASYFIINFVVLNYVEYLYRIDSKFSIKYFYLLLLAISAGFLISFFNLNFSWRLGNRYNGIYGNPNGLALSSFIYFIFAFHLYINKKIINKYIFFIFSFLIVLGLIYSASRGGLLSIIIFLFIYYLNKIKIYFKIIILSFVIPVAIFLSNPANLVSVARQLGIAEKFRVENAKDGGGRFLAWQVAMDNLPESILIGKGIDYDVYLFAGYQKMFLAMGHEGNVHNSFITILLNTGSIGLLFILIYLYSLLRQIKYQAFFYATLASCFFSAFFESWLSGSLNPYLIFFLTNIVIIISDQLNHENSVSLH